MKTKDLQAQKERYFAAHWGQEVLFDGIELLETVDISSMYDIFIEKKFYKYRHLKLKPLSEITDEDAIQINKLTSGRTPLNKHIIIDALNYNHNGIVNVVSTYLRNNSFAISFEDKSVDKLIELGWLKLSI